ncbi:hypothetical protein A33M_0105 [Rhodovulum sp. PH10]|uniref:DUF2628 domain-containing protein n=1 Tax=Rhodovulum sp. PH10 TaxID=1187851 RepID=UPI00027C1DB8|nr:DUF2628 domain-containing protein [Rhodovulum sp. PH10]EJW13248.1 hypothetical protein A33M_0105 [Rhodovulum sp. PH10]
MAVYAVLEPPARADGQATAAEDFRFVRDGFDWAAFLFGPLWMLWHRLWRTLLAYLAVMVVLSVAVGLLGVTPGWRSVAFGLVGLLIGLEAATLRRAALVRAGWRDHGIVVGDDRESAEQRFFSAWVARAGTAAAHDGGDTRVRDTSVRGILGLFPSAGVSR